MNPDPYKRSLIERALKFGCFVVRPRPEDLELDLEGSRAYRRSPFALCYRPEPGEADTGAMNELIALDHRMEVTEVLQGLSVIEMEQLLESRTAGLLLLADDDYFTRVRVWALYDEPYHYITQAIGEFPAAWLLERGAADLWRPLDRRTRFPKPSGATAGPGSDEPASDRFDALELLEQGKSSAKSAKAQKPPTYTTIPEEASPVRAVPAELAAAVKRFYGDMSGARRWPHTTTGRPGTPD